MKRKWKLNFWLVLATLFGMVLFNAPPAQASNPATVSFQGKVVNSDGTNVTDGTYSFVFKLYTVTSGGTAIWSETDSSITVASGVFQVQLGAGCPFFTANACNNSTPIDFNANPNLYLGITFNGDPAGEMSPRVQLQSVPFAYNADKVGGLSVSQLVQLSPGSQQTGNIDVSGSATFGNGLSVTNSTILNGGVTLGSTTTAGSLLFQDGTANNFAVTLNTAALGASYSLTLPTSGPGTSQCLKSGTTTASQLTFTSCDTGGEAFLANNQTFTGTNTFTGSGNGTTTYGALFQNAVDSATAFSVMDHLGYKYLTVDNYNNKVTVSNANLILNGVNAASSTPINVSASAGANTGGSLSGSASVTYYYSVSSIISGTESPGSTEVSINGSAFAPIAAPSTAATTTSSNGSGITGTYCYKYTYVTADGETTTSPASNCTTVSNKPVALSGIGVGPSAVTGRNIYRTTNGGSTYYFLATIADNVTTTYTDTALDSSLGAVEPATNTGRTDTNTASISFNLVTGASSYKVYRGTTSGGENAYQSTAASPFTDTGSAGTAGTPSISLSSLKLGVNTASPSANLDVVGTAAVSSTLSVSGAATLGNSLNVTGAAVLNGGATLGSTTTAGSILFKDGTTNNYGVTLGATALSASYSLNLPTGAPSTGQCLKSDATTASQLVFGTCGIGDAVLANSQTFSGDNIFTGSGDNSSVYGALFKNATDSTTAFAIQNAAGSKLFAIDTTDRSINMAASTVVLSSAPDPSTVPSGVTVTAASSTGGSLSGASTTNYYYEVTAMTGTSESQPSTEKSINGTAFSTIASPTTAPTSAQTNGSGLTGTYCYEYTFVTANGETTPSPASNCTTISNKKISVTAIATGPTGTTARNLYRTTNGGASYFLDTTIADNTTTSYTDSLADGSLGAAAPTTNSARLNTNTATINFTTVSGATSYRIYRGTSSGGEGAYQTVSAPPFTDTGAAGTAGTPPVSTAVAHFGINATSPSDSFDVVGTSKLSGATTIDNPGTSALSAGLSFSNSGGGGYTNYISSSNFILSGSGNIYGKGMNYFDPSGLTGASVSLGSGGTAGGNFGGVFSTGAVIGNTDSYAQEFIGSKASTTVNNTNIGDDGKWYFNNATGLTPSGQDFSTNGGYFRLTMGTTSARGALVAEGATAGTLDTPLVAANLPIVQMKVRPSVLSATDDLVFGAMDTAAAPTANDTLPANGFVFWTNNGTGTTGWQGVVRSGGATVGTVNCPGSATTNFATGRIIVVNSTTVRFFIDNDATNGISFQDCGTVTGTLPSASLAMGMYDVHTTTTSTTFDLDYARFWQDDSPVVSSNADNTLTSEQTQADLSTAGDSSPATPPVTSPTDSTALSQVSEPLATSDLQTTPVASGVALTDASGQSHFQFDSQGNASLNGNLSLGTATLSGGLTVGGDATFSGLSFFQKVATFLAKVIFKQDVEFDGHIAVSSDTAGYATISSGQTMVHVTFAKPYDAPPVVTANVSDGQFVSLATNNITATGFDILIPDAATQDLHLSWTAIGVINPQTSTSTPAANAKPAN